MTAAQLDVQSVTWAPARGKPKRLHETGFSLSPGRVLGVLGPNGAGKTTLLRLLYRFHRPTSGQVLVDEQDIWSLPPRRVAQRVAAVLQEQPSDFALTVAEIVQLGRTPHRKGFASTGGARDRDIVEAALERLDLAGFAHRHLGTLSGGERQRVMVARALAQEPGLLILDEPTNHLDIRHQMEVLELIRNLPLTIVTSLHDLNLAMGVCDDVLLLQNGEPMGFGPPQDVLPPARVSRAFDVDARLERLMPSGTDHYTFHLQTKGT